MNADRIEYLRAAWPDCEAIQECLDEIERLQDGRLTSTEFNQLCHNLHEHGSPMTREEHAAECDKFRDLLYPMHSEPCA